ncbi:MAG: CpsD/CapB family tyrosine-protein kinase [Bacillota bacterium]|nr:CpsD/CapB family tyrosine-protein kinase [Bacillota bacterium]
MAKRSVQFDTDEMYRQLRTNIEFSNLDKEIKLVNFMSTLPNEGKSTMALNLARVSADQFDRVLLIDCDLRNSSLHRLLKISKGKGLSNVLANFSETDSILECEDLQVIETKTGKQYYFLSAGDRVPNPLEMISSKKFFSFLQKAKEEFDFIVIDSPPASLCSDGIPLCRAVDGTLYVVSGKDTDKRSAKSHMKELSRNGANIIGLCLTKIEAYTNKTYNYGYGYGYGKNTQGED